MPDSKGSTELATLENSHDTVTGSSHVSTGFIYIERFRLGYFPLIQLASNGSFKNNLSSLYVYQLLYHCIFHRLW